MSEFIVDFSSFTKIDLPENKILMVLPRLQLLKDGTNIRFNDLTLDVDPKVKEIFLNNKININRDFTHSNYDVVINLKNNNLKDLTNFANQLLELDSERYSEYKKQNKELQKFSEEFIQQQQKFLDNYVQSPFFNKENIEKIMLFIKKETDSTDSKYKLYNLPPKKYFNRLNSKIEKFYN